MFTEDQFIQISSLQHFVFCARQCALIHLEGVWDENVHTIRGGILHERVDTDTYESRGCVKTVRGLRIHSYQYGLSGRCDVVEFRIPGAEGKPAVVPVEFKSGEPKEDRSDEVQLCAQCICLEEMLGTSIERGAFFYGRVRRRVPVAIDPSLRQHTYGAISAVHDLLKGERVPPARHVPQCRSCSIADFCQPKAMNTRRLTEYLRELYRE